MTTLADSTPALPPNTPTWVIVLVAALPAIAAIAAAAFQPMTRALGRRKKRHQDAERALIRAEEAAIRERERQGEPTGTTPPVAPGSLSAQLDTGMQLVEQMVRDLQDRVNRLESARDELQRRLDEVEHDLSKREVEIAQLRAENSELRRENERLRDQIQLMSMQQQRGRGP